MKARQAARKTIVEKVHVFYQAKGEPLFPKSVVEDHPEWPGVWTVMVRSRSGTRPPSMYMALFASEEEAREHARERPVGSELNAFDLSDDTDLSFAREISQQYIDEGYFPGGIDGFSCLVYEQLTASGILDGSSLSDDVINFLGDERISELKERFGDENWTVAAEMEFCFAKLPRSSPAYLAAAYNYNYFIRNDDLTAGYLLRDLEIVVNGIEAEAARIEGARKKAGEKGKAASAGARAKRRIALLDGMEAFAQRNPDITALGDRALAGLALEECVEAEPALWAQGQKQISEYLGEIRRGEAGEDAMARYHVLFPQKPPKRFT